MDQRKDENIIDRMSLEELSAEFSDSWSPFNIFANEWRRLLQNAIHQRERMKFEIGDRVKAEGWRGDWRIIEISSDSDTGKPYYLESWEKDEVTHFPTSQGAIPLSEFDRKVHIWVSEDQLSCVDSDMRRLTFTNLETQEKIIGLVTRDGYIDSVKWSLVMVNGKTPDQDTNWAVPDNDYPPINGNKFPATYQMIARELA